jgi:hypothetical protein
MPDDDTHPRLQERLPVLFRALCHGALILRGLMEQIIATRTDDIEVGRSKTRSVVLNRWLRTQGLAEHLTPREDALLDKEPGTWQPPERAFASWRVEAQGVLVWSIEKLNDIPPVDALFDPGAVIDALPNIAPIESFLRHSRLRPADDLVWARDVAELWHWRTRIEQTRRAGVEPPPGTTYEGRIAHVTQGAHEHGAIPAPVQGDFPVGGQAVTALPDAALTKLHTTAYYRHFALNWVCGYAPPDGWEETPTHT